MPPEDAIAWMNASEESIRQALERGIYVEGQTAAIAVGILAGLGVINCLFGYRVIRLLLALWGLILLGAIGSTIGMHLDPANEYHGALIGAIAGGVIGALAFGAIYFVGVFFVGAVLGAGGAAAFYNLNAVAPSPMVVGIAAAACGLVALVLQKIVVILGTSFAGGVCAVYGGYFFLANRDLIDVEVFDNAGRNKAFLLAFQKAAEAEDPEQTRAVLEQLGDYALENPILANYAENHTLLAFSALGLALVGTLVQFFLTSRKRPLITTPDSGE